MEHFKDKHLFLYHRCNLASSVMIRLRLGSSFLTPVKRPTFKSIEGRQVDHLNNKYSWRQIGRQLRYSFCSVTLKDSACFWPTPHQHSLQPQTQAMARLLCPSLSFPSLAVLHQCNESLTETTCASSALTVGEVLQPHSCLLHSLYT